MKRTLEISTEELGEALIGYIGLTHSGYNPIPFIVKHSSMRLDGEISVVLSDEPFNFAGIKRGNVRNFFPDNATFTLSKDEILVALAYEINVFKLARRPPVKILEVSPKLPEEIRVTLKYEPKGTLIKDSPHCFDGSL
jgi:hypothetical protein